MMQSHVLEETLSLSLSMSHNNPSLSLISLYKAEQGPRLKRASQKTTTKNNIKVVKNNIFCTIRSNKAEIVDLQ